jgi:hypothetical protein
MTGLPPAEAETLLHFLTGEIYTSRQEIEEAIENGFRTAYPDPLSPENEARIRRAHLERLTASMTKMVRQLPECVLLVDGLRVVREASEANAVRVQVEEYFRKETAKIRESTQHFETSAPDFRLAGEALGVVRRHHARPAGERRWGVNLPSGDHIIVLGDRDSVLWWQDSPRRVDPLPQPAGFVGRWDLDDGTVATIREAIDARGVRFTAAVRVLLAFSSPRGIDATPLQCSWDRPLALRVEAAIQTEQTASPPTPAQLPTITVAPTVQACKVPEDQLSPQARAIAIMWDYRDKHGKLISVPELLKMMPGVSKPTLYRPKGRFKAARAAVKKSLLRTVPKGHPTPGGGVDAVDEDED